MTKKVLEELDAGVPQFSVVDPDLETVTVCRIGYVPVMWNREQELNGELRLPEFTMAVAELID